MQLQSYQSSSAAENESLVKAGTESSFEHKIILPKMVGNPQGAMEWLQWSEVRRQQLWLGLGANP